MEKRGIIDPGHTPPEKDDTTTRMSKSTDALEKAAESELDAIRRLDGDFRKVAAERARKAL